MISFSSAKSLNWSRPHLAPFPSRFSDACGKWVTAGRGRISFTQRGSYQPWRTRRAGAALSSRSIVIGERKKTWTISWRTLPPTLWPKLQTRSGRKQVVRLALHDLAFKSNKAAFEYACASMRCDVVKGQELPALVVGATHAFAAPAPVAKGGRDLQTAVLRVASSDGGFLAVALSFGRGPDLNVGDLVAWVPGEYCEDLAATSADRRFGWVGLIVGTLEPRYVQGNWIGKNTFGTGPQAVHGRA